MKLALGLVVLAACGDNLATPTAAAELVVVAHQDDDLLFMQSDLYDVVHGQRPIEVVYVTAGDGGNGIDYANARITSAKFAYGSVAGSQQWTCQWTLITAHAAQRCTLADRPVTLLFLGYPDGGIGGSAEYSLLHLWQGAVSLAPTVADVETTYTREELIDTVAAIIDQAKPQTIRTLELAGTHGYDHADHMMVGALTQLALARTTSTAELISYRGYNINDLPANLTDEDIAQSTLFMRAYDSCMGVCGVCGVTPCDTIADGWYDGFLHRKYTVGMQEEATGVLTSRAGCVGFASTDDATLVNCAAAPDLAIDEVGLVRTDDQCLEVEADGTLGLGTCDPDPTRYFQLDDEGHLWSGVVTPGAPMLFDHTSCVYVDSGKVSVGVCGADRDYRWTLRP